MAINFSKLFTRIYSSQLSLSSFRVDKLTPVKVLRCALNSAQTSVLVRMTMETNGNLQTSMSVTHCIANSTQTSVLVRITMETNGNVKLHTFCLRDNVTENSPR